MIEIRVSDHNELHRPVVMFIRRASYKQIYNIVLRFSEAENVLHNCKLNFD